MAVCQVRVLSFLSTVAMALAMILVVAVRNADVASGEVVESWNEWSHASWQTLSEQMLSSASISLWRWPHSSLDRPTEDMYRAAHQEHYGKYASLRSKLDYAYHSNYNVDRQHFQDSIMDDILNSTWIMDENGHVCQKPTSPWIVFTAGAMGAGKSWSVRQLAQHGYFPLESFVTVDPDEIRRHLPEFDYLIKNHPDHAGEWTRKEAGFVAELLTQVSLEQGRNVLVDGSLRDAAWYRYYFQQLRESHPRLQIAILHVTAPRDLVMKRADERSKTTGRVVPRKTLEDALEQVPKSIALLRPECDFFAEIQNSHSLQLTTGTWDDFRQAWTQNCQDTARS